MICFNSIMCYFIDIILLSYPDDDYPEEKRMQPMVTNRPVKPRAKRNFKHSKKCMIFVICAAIVIIGLIAIIVLAVYGKK